MISLLRISGPTACLAFFFFNDTATTEIYTLSLHDALPICPAAVAVRAGDRRPFRLDRVGGEAADRKSTRLNSSHSQISYAVFCLKKKNLVLRMGVVIHHFLIQSETRRLYLPARFDCAAC